MYIYIYIYMIFILECIQQHDFSEHCHICHICRPLRNHALLHYLFLLLSQLISAPSTLQIQQGFMSCLDKQIWQLLAMHDLALTQLAHDK